MATVDSGVKVIGYSVVDDIMLAQEQKARHVDSGDYTYERTIPNKAGGTTAVVPEPLTPYPERNDARVAALEQFHAALEDVVVEHDKRLDTLESRLALVDVRVAAIESRLAHYERMLQVALNPEGDHP